ncbi:unnamed protein product [Kluyveromyces dobzhanskii CBS 2104]|uniref:WGS project CCBQ000000000 data, contig 00016 n=1 Tax=Kluyveromyces dobzhanskii CBS 2104 TaxID=1427455 RepID=A0A0A8L1U5_9SACH|nr:unnamed protein product [Kluyveromyces dobzhanskii CBS 2104]
MVRGDVLHSGWIEQAKINFSELFQSICDFARTPNTSSFKQTVDTNQVKPHLIESIHSTSCHDLRKEYVEDTSWLTVYHILKYKAETKDPILLWIILTTALVVIYKVLKWHTSTKYITNLEEIKHIATEPNAELVEEEFVTRPLVHFPAEQRALLQFQRNKSEPIVFRYGFNFDENKSDFGLPDESTDELIRNSLSNTRTPSPLPSHSLSPRLFKETDVQDIHSNILKFTETPQKTKQLSILNSARSKISANLQLPLSISPAKPTVNTTKLSSEQASAEPFKF